MIITSRLEDAMCLIRGVKRPGEVRGLEGGVREPQMELSKRWLILWSKVDRSLEVLHAARECVDSRSVAGRQLVVAEGALPILGLIKVVRELLGGPFGAGRSRRLNRLADLSVQKSSLALKEIRKDALAGKRMSEDIALLAVRGFLLDELRIDASKERLQQGRL